jgi:FKBP-type peptidyl-prolyl cis-trans isomerase
MRWTMAMALAIAPLVGGAAAQQTPAPAQNKTQQEAQASAIKAEQKAAATAKTDQEGPPITFQSRTDKLSYALGVNLAHDLQRQKNSFNVDLLMKAMTDTLSDKLLIMTDDEVAATLKEFEAEQKQDLQHARMMVSERDKREGEAFFAENLKKEGVVTLPSGLQYKILTKGDGKIATVVDTIVCNYRGTLLDGTEIDSSYKRKEPTTAPVKDLIPGWSQALQLMPVGSKWQLFVPPQLAYGDQAAGPIPPNATLIFEVELLSIQEKPQTVSAR